MSTNLEKILRPVDTPLPWYDPKYMQIANGEIMVIRQITRDEVPDILPYVKAMIHVEREFYDLVSVRLYAELLSYYMYRVQDEYVFVGQVEGELVAIVNGRTMNKDQGMSLHTMALRRGLRIGAHCFAAKMEYHIDFLKQNEVFIVAESPIGFRRFLIEYELEPRLHIQHELGGVPSYVLTRELFEKARSKLVVGRRPVPDELLKKAEAAFLPPSDPPTFPEDRLAATRSQYDVTGTSVLFQRWKQEGRM